MRHRKLGGFLLIELAVVMILIALVLSLATATFGPRANNEHLDACSNVLRTLTAASNAYARDNQGLLPQGMDNPWVKNDFLGTSYYAQNVLDPSQICGIGLLMQGNYVPEKRESISCPQTDSREDKGFNAQTWMPIVNFTSQKPNDDSDRSLSQGLDRASPIYYRNIANYTAKFGLVSTYAIRGPSLRTDSLSKTVAGKTVSLVPVEAAWLADHEAADQKLIPEVEKNGKKPIDGWGRVHIQGINTAYLDGHVAMFLDEDRSKTWAGNQVKYYGNSIAMDIYDLDQ